MSDQVEDGSVEARVAVLEHQVQELLGVVAAQRAVIDGAASTPSPVGRRAQDEPAVGVAASSVVAPPIGADPILNRRRLLFGGAAAAAVATAAVAGTATPAAAANGGNLILGQNNTATAETKLSYGGSTNNGFRVEGGSSLAMIEGYQTGSAAGVKGAHAGAGTAVEGLSATGTGVRGEAGDIGVFGKSTGGGNGVYGESDGYGVAGLSAGGAYGVIAQSGGVGLFAKSTGGGLGIQGESTGNGVGGLSTGSGIGVIGQSGGVAVKGFATEAGTALEGYASGAGPGLRAESATGIGVVALGARADLHFPVRFNRAAPSTDATAHSAGEVLVDGSAAVWLCIAGGTPGTWRKIGGPATAGAFHVLAAPARIVDTRPGGVPTSVVPKTPLAAGSTRVYDLKVNNSGVPVGATAALITVLLVNANNGNGNLTLWANGVAKPTANTMVWGAGAGRWTATAVSALDSQARVQVNVSAQTDLVLDVVGYYR